MKNIRLLFATSLYLLVSGCSTYKTSPSIVFANVSEGNVYSIRSSWGVGHQISDSSPLISDFTPGKTFVFNFAFLKQSDLFGPIKLQWQNAKGKAITKNFELKKEDIPNFSYKKRGSVEFYIMQNDAKMFILPYGARRSQEQKKLSKQAAKYERQYLNKLCPPKYYFGCEGKKK